ncbi:magnesium transporter [Pedobacter cryoconitis]|uniref:magnesium transporter n=1 Tax=Pedobacter cryoconitis TaxID=188932 RepID=UPI001618184A|nr:magnesium transporter [Pedobacter cryoconitis]MBB6270614.1 magnesium transporter [Pedobacter cryoconitis]
MNLPFKEARKNILAGDFSGLFKPSHETGYIHPSEVAQLFVSIPAGKAIDAYNSFSPKQQVNVLPYLDIQLQKKIINSISKDRASYILNNLKSDDRTIFYSSSRGIELSRFMEYLNDENRNAVANLLGYPAKSVARIINTDFATVDRTMTIAEATEHLRLHHQDTEAANVIYVVDVDGKLIDDVPVRRLVLNERSKKIMDIVDGFCISLKITDTKEDAVQKFKEYDRVVLPVVSDDYILLGVVTIDDVMDVAEQKATAEIQKFGGIEELDFPYVKTPFFSLLKKRAGWLIVLFLGEMLTATAMGYFDGEISKAVVLALFVPLIISSGGNSGSQAATLIIRAMALKELNLKDWWYVMRREILSGLVLGIILGTIGFIRIAIWQNLHWYDYGIHWLLLAITIFFSLIGIVMWGTLSGSMVPMVLKKCKIDPATSSAPFVATLVDVTGLVIYFSIAAIFLKGTLL